MKNIKMPYGLKELLTIEGASKGTIALVEEYFNDSMKIVAELQQQPTKKGKQQKEKTPSIQEIANNARIIK